MASKSKRLTTKTVKVEGRLHSDALPLSDELVRKLVPIVAEKLQEKLDSIGVSIKVHLCTDSIEQVCLMDAMLSASDYSMKFRSRLTHMKDFKINVLFDGVVYEFGASQHDLLTISVDTGRSRNVRQSHWLIKIDSVKEVKDDEKSDSLPAEH